MRVSKTSAGVLGSVSALTRPYVPKFEPMDLVGVLEEIESTLIHNAYLASGFNKRQAARLLGLSERSFHYRFKKMRGRAGWSGRGDETPTGTGKTTTRS